ncbi:MAG: MtrB/PioB family decaheme-associated outer membrane protein [Rhodoferax sp.]|uniref:MtrB/PioB family decaheme-associated outer membrane protein n=1 Tax=Rhodoferax sp. TaxID=50421 RepID=UPI001B589A42|nr:MtrB/PioB family decaheme-associated outer membrane protein [Rhodoferax sp.]MBP9905886.1 MtrB/PioB family decaheme-associated outer membrane protein [Rhodoferax sp.]
MTHSDFSSRFRLSAVALAACTLCVSMPAAAGDDEAPPVQATIAVGAGLVNGTRADRALFGQYYGLEGSQQAVGILDIDYRLRKHETATWIDFKGENLLGDSREMHLVWRNPGEWKASVDYSELVHYDPNSFNSGLSGVGSTNPQVALLPGGLGTGTEFDLKTKRTGLGVGFSKRVSNDVQIDIELKTEKKEGSRLFGVGMNCFSAIASCGPTTGFNTGWALLMLPEPISANHSQMEARLTYARDKFSISAGYYGSFYRNDYSTLNPAVPSVLNNPLGSPLSLSSGLQALLSQPVALTPDNQAHQLDVAGSYAFTDTTRAMFRLAYANATQDSNFAADGLAGAPVGVSSLAGKVITTSVRLGVSSHPMRNLTLLADLRYDDKDDQTPLAYYNNADGSTRYTNRTLPDQRTRGKLEANWQFSGGYRGTVAANYESIDRGAFTASSAAAGISALRQQTDETTLRAELRRQLTEDFSGTVALSSSKRTGSNWLRDNSGVGVTEVVNPADAVNGFLPGAVFMPMLADRNRDKVRLYADWQASKKLTLQFTAEGGKDSYSSPSTYGLQDTRMNHFGIDFAYAESFNWNFNGYLSHGVQSFNQSRYAGYVMAFENTSLNAGLGFTGKVNSNFEIGGNVTFSDEKSVYAQTLDRFATADSVALLAATGGLPDVVYRQTALKLFGNYALDKRSGIRVDLVHQRTKINDWAWNYNGVPFAYSDGTTVMHKPSQSASFIGISYIYRLP